jgi:hypothetical protein
MSRYWERLLMNNPGETVSRPVVIGLGVIPGAAETVGHAGSAATLGRVLALARLRRELGEP